MARHYLKYPLLALFSFVGCLPVAGQLSETSANPVNGASAVGQASSVLTQAGQVFSGARPVSSVVMTGMATWTTGSVKGTGPAKLTANISGENSAEFNLSTGTRVENQSAIADDRTCGWSGSDGKQHNGASSNCWTATVWFLPHLALQSQGQPQAIRTAASAASEGSLHVRHTLHIAPAGSPAAVAEQVEEWSRTDLTLDSTTLLPSVLKFNIHPDHRSMMNLPVEVRYSSYKNVSGVQLPMHIERYVNGSLQITIDIDSATIN